jgi:hypothetical protein
MPHDKSLLHFMETECDFSTEHADGVYHDALTRAHPFSESLLVHSESG